MTNTTPKLPKIRPAVASWRDRLNDRLPGPVEVGLLTIRIKTTRGKRLLDRVSSYRRVWAVWHDLGILLSLAYFLLMAVLVVGSAWLTLVATPEPTPVNQPSNAVAVPVVNDMMPLSVGPYVVLTLLVSATVHELGHALACRADGVAVEEMGLFCLGPLPMGAYVKPDEDALEEAPLRTRLRVYSAGVLNNTALAIASIPLFVSQYTADWMAVSSGYFTALLSGGQDLSGLVGIDPLSHTLFWLVFLNVNLALTNAIPMLPLDGGQILRSLVGRVASWVGVDEPVTVRLRVRLETMVVIGVSVVMGASLLIGLIGPKLLA